MTNPYPLPREIRETAPIAGDGRSTYGPLNFKIWDAADVVAIVRRQGAANAPEAVTATKVANQPFDDFTVTFSPALAAGDVAVVQSRRLQERSTDVTRGGAISGVALEREFSVIGTVLQELRRDADRADNLGGGSGGTGGKGDKGDKGDKGETGATGPAGAAGDKGDKGDAGAKGDKGDKGEKGDPGAGSSGAVDARDVVYFPTPTIMVPLHERLGKEVFLTDGYVAGLTDFSDLFVAGMQRALDEGRPLHIPGGRFSLTRRPSFTTAKPVTITGDGNQLSQLFWPAGSSGDGLQFIATVDRAGGLFEDFGLVTQLDCLNTAIGFNLAQQAAPIGGGDTLVLDRMRPRCNVRSVYMAGDDNVDAYGFNQGFTSEMALQVRVTDCTFVGRRIDQFSSKSLRAFNLGTATNRGHPVENYVDRCAMYYAQTGARFEGCEGMFARGNHAVYVDTGYEFVDGTGRPHVECVGNHANFNLRGVAADGVREVRVDGNSLYHQGPTNKNGVAIGLGGVNCQNIQVNDNFIVNGIDTTGQLKAIDVYNCDHGKIDGNQIVSQVPGRGRQGAGIALSSNTRFVVVGANNVFPNADSGRQTLEYNVNDFGGKNTIGVYGAASGGGTTPTPTPTPSGVAGTGARFRLGGDYYISGGSLQIIAFANTEDGYGDWGDDMSDGVYTIPSTGLWQFTGNIQLSTSGSESTVFMNFQHNATSGNPIASWVDAIGSNAVCVGNFSTGPRRMNAGDQVRVGINTSVSRNVQATVNTFVEVRRLA